MCVGWPPVHPPARPAYRARLPTPAIGITAAACILQGHKVQPKHIARAQPWLPTVVKKYTYIGNMAARQETFTRRDKEQ